MQKISNCFFGMLFILFSITTFAQSTVAKQKLYAAFPATVNIDKSSLDNIFENTAAAKISVPFSTSFGFTGTVFSNTFKYDNMQTILLRATENAESIFQITKITTGDNKFIYKGRIFNANAADGYEIMNANDKYFLQKFETAKIMEPCKL